MIRCVDCKFYSYFNGYCNRKLTHVIVRDPVNGGTKEKDTSSCGAYSIRAEDERRAHRPWKCGMKARYFVPAPTVSPGLIR